jgi:hypothetical protein
VYGDRFFEYLSRNSEQEAVFQGSMTGRAEDEAGHVVAAYDFGGLGPAGRRRPGCGEALLRERAADQPAVIRIDLYMLVLLGARERTEAQFRRLLAETGFAVRRVVPTASPAGLSVIEAAPAARPNWPGIDAAPRGCYGSLLK